MLNDIIQIVLEVGGLLQRWKANDNLKEFYINSSYKSEADLLAHKEIVKRLSKIKTRYPIISEEDLKSHIKIRPKKYWLTDPIDGTASYVNGYKGYTTQIAYMEDNTPTLAAIYAPAFDLLYSAEKGRGVRINGKKICPIRNRNFDILIDNYPKPRGIANKLYKYFDLKSYIECGGISLKICRVADGTADVLFKDVIVKDWDLAAPHLILSELNGVLTDITGNMIQYYGGYDHKGLIASRSEEICKEIVQWYNNISKRNKK